MYGQLIYDKEGKNIYWRKDCLFNKLCWENLPATCKNMKLQCSLTLYTEINTTWIKDITFVRQYCRTLFDINHNNIFVGCVFQNNENKSKNKETGP